MKLSDDVQGEPETVAARPVGKPGAPSWKRVVRRTLYAKLAILVCVALVLGAVYLRLVVGPVSLESYSARVADALADRLGPGWSVVLSDTAIELRGTIPGVRASGIEIRNPLGVLVVKAPFATVSLDPSSLVFGNLVPREIELRDLQLTALVARDGSLSFFSSADAPSVGAAAAPPGAPVAAPTGETGAEEPPPSSVSRAVASLLDPVMRPTSLVGSLDRAQVSGAKLRLIGYDGRERVGFTRVDALFERLPESGRRLAVEMDGPHGRWSIGGSVRDGAAGREANLEAGQVPVEDLLLLSGLSGLPAESDVKLSGRVAVALAGGRVTRLGGSFESSQGRIALPGQSPIQIERLSGQAAWDEPARRLDLAELDLKSGQNALKLAGALAADPGAVWRLRLAGRDGTLGGFGQDPVVTLAEVGLEVGFAESGLTLDRLLLKGPELDVTMAAASVSSADGIGMRGNVAARATSVRHLLAIWPEGVNPELRGYLGANMTAGMVDTMQLVTDLDPEDLKSAFSGRPISDKGLDLSFAASDARMKVVEGLPPLRRLSVTGKATGTTTSLISRQARIDMPDGRRLNFSDGSYNQVDEHKPGSVAHVAFRLDGGADAVASLLRSPIFRDLGFDIDPASVKGRADLRVALPLDVHNIPKIADLAVVVGGTISDLSLDRVLGREKLDGGNLAVSYESGALGIKGDGRLGGSPATFDVRLPKGAPGDVLATVILDEAARTRRSLPSAPAVQGPVTVKVAAPFGPGGKGPTRIEADLSKASVDGLLPGWTKPAGRPGRLALSLGDGDQPDLRDIQLEAGPVQLRGSASLGPDGGIDRADITSLRLSPGDDLKAQFERGQNGYRIALRGNVGDARPVLKWLNAGSGGPQKGRDAPDVDVEIGVNIVTGHNNEALTGVTGRISTRGRDLRNIQLKGQFRSSPVEAQLARGEGSQPVVVVRSGDAGATLRFLDIYQRMVGGTLQVQTTTGDVQGGTIEISDFALRNEPALRRIVAQNVPQGSEDRTGNQTPQIPIEQVEFKKLTADFRRTASRVDYKDVVIWGPQVGFTLSGYVDYGRDRTDILGTFVPAYGLNNAFSQVPIVGLILGGGNTNEGLFAIDFRVSGAATSPTLTVNPLTAVAPGILRKFLGWMMPEEQATGTTSAPAPRRVKPKAQ